MAKSLDRKQIKEERRTTVTKEGKEAEALLRTLSAKEKPGEAMALADGETLTLANPGDTQPESERRITEEELKELRERAESDAKDSAAYPYDYDYLWEPYIAVELLDEIDILRAELETVKKERNQARTYAERHWQPGPWEPLPWRAGKKENEE